MTTSATGKGPARPDDHPAFDLALLRGERKAATAFLCEGLAPGGTAARIMAAAVSGDSAALAALLTRPDALPDFENNHGVTPLMAAAARGHVQAADLLARQALVNLARADRDGWTALHFAAFFDEAEAAHTLVLHRAPPLAANGVGYTPLDIAGDKVRTRLGDEPNVRDALKGGTLPPSKRPPEKDPLKEAFFRAVTSVGLEWRDNPALNPSFALYAKIAAMGKDDFRETFTIIEAAKPDFDWQPVFIAAAEADNAPVMRFLQGKFGYRAVTLEYALAAAVIAGDNRAAVHDLTVWGADPKRLVETGGRKATIADTAFRLGRAGALEEMILWSDRISQDDAASFLYNSMLMENGAELNAAANLHFRKKAVRKLRPKPLRRAFREAVAAGDIDGVMAAYAEARHDRLLRSPVEFSRADGGAAIAVALRQEKFTFARLLVAEGYTLKDAPADMQSFPPGKARDFAEAHLSGRLEIDPVERRLRRSDLPPMYFGGMGHYGMF